MSGDPVPSPDWIEDCMRWRGRVLTGKHAHWCHDWDCLPIDETTDEFPCACFPELRAATAVERAGGKEVG